MSAEDKRTVLGDISEVERQTRDRKVSGSIPGGSGGNLFFVVVVFQMSVLTLISVCVPSPHPLLPQERERSRSYLPNVKVA